LRPSTSLVAAVEFDEVLAMIESARQRAYQAVNTELVGLYWQLGAYISDKIESAQWGDGVVDDLAAAIGRQFPGMRGYIRSNLFRMRQFYETYRSSEIVAPLVRQLPWLEPIRKFRMVPTIRWCRIVQPLGTRAVSRRGCIYRAAPEGALT
jgi:hypothetical protein